MAEREFKEIILEYEARVRLSDMRIKQLEEEIAALEAELVKLYSETAADGEGSDAD